MKKIFSKHLLDSLQKKIKEHKETETQIQFYKEELKMSTTRLVSLKNKLREDLNKNMTNLLNINHEDLDVIIKQHIEFIELSYKDSQDSIFKENQKKEELFYKVRQEKQKEIKLKQEKKSLLLKHKIYDKIYEMMNTMFKIWGGHQEDLNCIVCKEYLKVPYKINSSCKCYYNVCEDCVKQHYAVCRKDEKLFRCIVCSKNVLEQLNIKQQFFVNEKLLQNINNVIMHVSNEIKKYTKISIDIVHCNQCQKSFQDLKKKMNHICCDRYKLS